MHRRDGINASDGIQGALLQPLKIFLVTVRLPTYDRNLAIQGQIDGDRPANRHGGTSGRR